MPPAPSVSQTPSTALSAAATAGVRLEPGASLGLDFAKIMARQFERMPQSQRQAFAAPSPSSGADNTNTTRAHAQAQADDKGEQATHRQALDAAHSDQTSDTRNHQVRAEQSSSNANNVNDANDTPAQTHSSKRAPHRTSPENSAPPDTLLANSISTPPNVVSADTPVAVVTAAPLPTPGTAEVRPQALQANPYLKDVALPSSDAATATPLRTVALSPHMRIITDPRQAPSPESLTAFAKSMGLDEAAIQKLMGPVSTSAEVLPDAITSSATDTPTELTVSLNPPSAQLTDKLASPLLNAAMQANGNGNTPVHIAALTTPGPNADLTQGIVVNNIAATTVIPTVGAALQGLTPTDLANIQHIQITVLPPAVAQTSATHSTPSTAAVLSLMGSGVNEQDITALAASFEPGTAGEDAGQQQASSGDARAGQFGQAMSRQVVPTNTSIASSTHAASDVHMSEVYDQLSDKMATEMAARMHKQLSDGEWKMKFGLRPANLGGVEIQLEMKDGKLDAVIHADNPLTRDLLQNSSQRLRDALENFGIHAGQFHIGQDSRGTQQNPSRGSAKQSQVGENSPSQVKSSSSVTSAEAVSTKANASLLDLYA